MWTAAYRARESPTKPAPGWNTTFTVPPRMTRLNPRNSPETWTLPSTLIVLPAFALAIADLNAAGVETSVAFLRRGCGESRYAVNESKVGELDTVIVVGAVVVVGLALAPFA